MFTCVLGTGGGCSYDDSGENEHVLFHLCEDRWDWMHKCVLPGAYDSGPVASDQI